MCAVAEGGIFRMLTAAEIDFFGFCDFYFDGSKRRAFMTAITERLIGAAATSTPPISTGF